MTYRNQILSILHHQLPNGGTCTQICEHITPQPHRSKKQLSATISSILCKMVDAQQLTVTEATGVRGGKVYQLPK